MSAARDDILGGIRRALRRGPLPADKTAELVERVIAHRRNLVPARAAALDRAGRVDLFVTMAEEVQTTVARVSSEADIPAEVARYLAAENLPAELVAAPDPSLDTIPWDTRPLLHIRRGRAAAEDAVSLTPVPRRGGRDRHPDARLRAGHADDPQFPAGHPYRRAACRPGRGELRGWLGPDPRPRGSLGKPSPAPSLALPRSRGRAGWGHCGG